MWKLFVYVVSEGHESMSRRDSQLFLMFIKVQNYGSHCTHENTGITFYWNFLKLETTNLLPGARAKKNIVSDTNFNKYPSRESAVPFALWSQKFRINKQKQ